VFKYSGFFLDNAARLLPQWNQSVPSVGLSLLLPVGISFYTFQALAYTIEVYRGRLQPAMSFLDFALYLAFFPKLIAGPLVRPDVFLKQLNEPASSLKREVWMSACGLLLLGLFKKVVIADSLASLSDVSFRAAAQPPGAGPFPAPLYWRGFYLYAFQIYADFSGYTDIACASAALLGFSLPENFRQPYLATTPAEFWRRWHMTLTQWFREYLFFPLNRILLARTQRRWPQAVQTAANITTLSLIGLWHGAAWTFVAWGVWHGILISVDRLLNLKPIRRWQAFLCALVNFHLIGMGWILFGAVSLASAARFLQGLASFDQWSWWPVFAPPVLLTAGLVLSIDLFANQRLSTSSKHWQVWRPVLAVAALVVVGSLMLLRMLGDVDARPFIYGRF
jgi:D-alanyl-lipoteichoic acid acyltransferase DltB (MBOAT superfamily)